VSEVLYTGDITKQMGSNTEQRFHDMWFSTFREHSLSFTHWYEIYQHEKAEQLELAKMIPANQQEQEEDDNWNDIPMAAQQPSPASPTDHFAKVPCSGVKQLNYVNHFALTNKEQKRLIKESQRFTKKLTEQTQIISQSFKDQPVSHKPGIASMVDDWMTNEIRGKLMDSLESIDFIPFSTLILDTSLNDLFFSDISAK